MILQRKRYNYLPNSASSNTKRQFSNKQNYNIYDVQPVDLFKSASSQDRAIHQSNEFVEVEKISQLETINKKMIQETKKQFEKFQQDVAKVEGILRIKEQQVQELTSVNQELVQDRAILVQALNQKQFLIQELHTKLTELIAEKQHKKQHKSDIETQTIELTVSSQQSQTTELEKEIPQVYYTAEEYQKIIQERQKNEVHLNEQRKKNQVLQVEVYKLKQQLYGTNSELQCVRQQFQTFKLLNQINKVKNMQ